MAKLKGVHASKKNQANAYSALNKAGKNKLANLERHLKLHPNDAQAAGASKTALTYKGRTQAKRTGARLNQFIGERDMIALAEVMIENKQATKEACVIQNRSLNLLNGRISAFGKRVQQGLKKARAAANQAVYDRKGKVFPKPALTKAERDLAKARALGKHEAASVSKAKAKKLKKATKAA